MSLLGRLEDLSLTDIVQIVFLSRRTGVLEIIDQHGRHTVLFRQGLLVNASSPEHPDLVTYLQQKGLVQPEKAASLRRMEEGGIPYGSAAVDMNMLTNDDLANAVRSRIVDVVTPLLLSREGEFNFILSDSMTALDIEYEPDVVFKEGGVAPQKILGGSEGEKIKPLKGLEESLKAGKALLRGASSGESTPASLNLGLGHPLQASPQPVPPREPSPPPAARPADDNVLPFRTAEEGEPFGAVIEDEPFPEVSAPFPDVASQNTASPGPLVDSLTDTAVAPPPVEPSPRPRQVSAQFKVAGGLFDIESPEAQFRNVVLYERNPMVRVAAKRAFARKKVKIAQYGSLEDVRAAMTDLFNANSFFVTFLELGDEDHRSDGPAVRLMQQLKHRNPRLPVVLIDVEADLRRRHDLLRAGADLYLTKPTPARLQPGLAEEELSLFADELVLFAERSFDQWEQLTGGLGPDAGRKFYELASKDSMERSFGVLRQLINELSNPNDIGEVSATILRLAAEYIDRGALFMATAGEFVGLGGFGVTGAGEEMDTRVKRMRIARTAPSILNDVAVAGEAHRGKIRKTPANVELIQGLGGVLPTEVVALPIMHSNRTIGILYGDNAEHHGPIDVVTGLEIFLSQAGYAFGNAVFASERGGRP
jgi:CheY-like chemotaxis protein